MESMPHGRLLLVTLGAALVACSAAGGEPFTTVADAGPRVDARGALDRGAPSGDAEPARDIQGAVDGIGGVDRPPIDTGATDVGSAYDTGVLATPDGCTATGSNCTPRPEGCEARERCGNGLDDDCNGRPDDTCPCVPGTVQDCFLGPPGRREVGQCSSGSQRCTGSGEFGTWGTCENALGPSTEVCDNLDNDCDGCTDEGSCCNAEISCPGANDMRVPTGQPFQPYALRGRLFYPGNARSWAWTITGGPCEALLPRRTFETFGLDQRDALFRPTLSGDYTVTLTVTTLSGQVLRCTFVVHIEGPGLRVELCWDTSTTVDLDLYLHDPRNMNPWFNGAGGVLQQVNGNSCNWANCEAVLRGSIGRSNWGYGNSPLSACENGPHRVGWQALGHCTNPRLDIDNNLQKAIGVPENANVDSPRDGERFRVMVQNFTGTAARPMLNIYCGGHLRGTIGAAPDTVPDMTGSSGHTSVGAMWRAVDVVTRVDARGVTTNCEVTPLHPPGQRSGHWVTRNDPSY